MPKVVSLPVSNRKNTATQGANFRPDGRDMPALRKGQFVRGKSGNQSGRPRGSQNKSHMRLRAILAEDAESVLQRVITAALEGDMLAARLILDRALPRRVCRPPMDLNLPALKTAADAAASLAKITHGIENGYISTAEGVDLATIVGGFTETLLARTMAAQIEALQEQLSELRG